MTTSSRVSGPGCGTNDLSLTDQVRSKIGAQLRFNDGEGETKRKSVNGDVSLESLDDKV